MAGVGLGRWRGAWAIGAGLATGLLLGCVDFSTTRSWSPLYSLYFEPTLVEVPAAPPAQEGAQGPETLSVKFKGYASPELKGRLVLTSYTGEFYDMVGQPIPTLTLPRANFATPLILSAKGGGMQEISFELAPLRAYFKSGALPGARFVTCRLHLYGEDEAHHAVWMTTDVPFRWGAESL